MINTRKILTVLFICVLATATLLVSGCTEAVDDVEDMNDEEIESEVISIEDITEVKWQWSGLIENEPASQSVVPDPENYTILFSEDGTYSIKADCNLGSGSYTLEGNELTLGPGPMTLAACGPESLYDMYVTLIGNVNSVAMEDGNLVLYSGENMDKMMFIASSEE
ncbi:META domain-containing protein [Methanolobus sp. ZRKC3]|uniref:META domain-containing protein n=1 Tax=Methanolobus sp. ZRKC3 TaxID=3125786 RepID=UPI0032514511